jgi:hypothetical protein
MASLTIVLNVDGSSLRKHDGSWIFGFEGNIGISSILHAELLAIYHGLWVAWETGYTNIICYSDFTLLIQLITANMNTWYLYTALISNIEELVSRAWSIQMNHTWREANVAANFSAKFDARNIVGSQTFIVPLMEYTFFCSLMLYVFSLLVVRTLYDFVGYALVLLFSFFFLFPYFTLYSQKNNNIYSFRF